MNCSFDKKMIAGALLGLGVAGTASAEVDTVNMAQQVGLIYTPLHVVMEKGLIEKHSKAIGIKAPNIKMFKISGGANINKALLAGTIDFGAHGVGPMLKLWGKSKGRYKGALTIADMPLKLNSNDPNVKTVEDYLNVKDHKIATPAEPPTADPSLAFAAARPHGIVAQRHSDVGADVNASHAEALGRFRTLAVQTGSTMLDQWKPEYLCATSPRLRCSRVRAMARAGRCAPRDAGRSRTRPFAPRRGAVQAP